MLVAVSLLHLLFLMAVPSLEAARYRACASRRACIVYGCALPGLHSLPFIPLMAAPYRACIRSAHSIDGCALSGLHSLRSFQTMLGRLDDRPRSSTDRFSFKGIPQTLTQRVRIQVPLHIAIVCEGDRA